MGGARLQSLLTLPEPAQIRPGLEATLTPAEERSTRSVAERSTRPAAAAGTWLQPTLPVRFLGSAFPARPSCGGSLPLTHGSWSMAAPGLGRWVLGLGPLLLQFFLPFQLVAGRWGPEGAGGGVRRGEPGRRRAVSGVRPRSGRRGSGRPECAWLGPLGGRGSSTPVPGEPRRCSRHGKPCNRGRLYSSPGGLE